MGTNQTITSGQSQNLDLLDFWMNGVTTNSVVLLGLIGNILTITILTRRAMRSSTNYYLCALAVWDSIVLISTALLIGLPAVPQMHYYKSYVYAYVVSFVYPLALTAQTATIWLTVSFTAERYIAVCHPLKAASMCTISRAKIVIIGVLLGSTLYNIPRWFDFRPAVDINHTTNTTVTIPARTNFSQNAVYRQIYFSWLYVPIMCIVPLLVLSILNLFLIRAVRRSTRQRKTMNVKQSRENNVTIMLVTIVIVFIICQVPALVYNIAFAIDDMNVDSQYSYKVLSYFRNFLVSVNSAVNFILYCALGQKFRDIFLHTFCRACAPDGSYGVVCGQHTYHTKIVGAPNRSHKLSAKHQPKTAATKCSNVNPVAPNKPMSGKLPDPSKDRRNVFLRASDFGDENDTARERLLHPDPDVDNHNRACAKSGTVSL